MRAEAERLIARLTLAKPVGIEAFEIEIEFGPFCELNFKRFSRADRGKF